MKQHNALAKLPKGVALCFPLMLRTCDDWKKIYIVPPQRACERPRKSTSSAPCRCGCNCGSVVDASWAISIQWCQAACSKLVIAGPG